MYKKTLKRPRQLHKNIKIHYIFFLSNTICCGKFSQLFILVYSVFQKFIQNCERCGRLICHWSLSLLWLNSYLEVFTRKLLLIHSLEKKLATIQLVCSSLAVSDVLVVLTLQKEVQKSLRRWVKELKYVKSVNFLK